MEGGTAKVQKRREYLQEEGRKMGGPVHKIIQQGRKGVLWLCVCQDLQRGKRKISGEQADSRVVPESAGRQRQRCPQTDEPFGERKGEPERGSGGMAWIYQKESKRINVYSI